MKRFLRTTTCCSSPIGAGATPRELYHAVAACACRRMLISLIVALGCLQWTVCAQAGSIVVPGAYATTEGNVALYRENLPPVRFQMLYEAAEFASLGGPVLITGLVGRPHAQQSSPASVSVLNFDYWLSTTNRTTSTLSPIFDDNRGADQTLVASYDPAIVFTTANIPGPGDTKEFDVAAMFSTPFRYDPAAGNLLLEVRTDGTMLESGTEFLTSGCVTGPSCPMRMVISIGSADATSGVYQDVGEIDLFLYEPVPEPASLLLTLGAVLGICTAVRSRK